MMKYGIPSFTMGINFYGFSKHFYRKFGLVAEEEIEHVDNNVSFISKNGSENEDDSDNDDDD